MKSALALVRWASSFHTIIVVINHKKNHQDISILAFVKSTKKNQKTKKVMNQTHNQVFHMNSYIKLLQFISLILMKKLNGLWNVATVQCSFKREWKFQTKEFILFLDLLILQVQLNKTEQWIIKYQFQFLKMIIPNCFLAF